MKSVSLKYEDDSPKVLMALKGVLWWMSGYAIDWPLMIERMHDKKKNDAMLNWKLSVNHSE